MLEHFQSAVHTCGACASSVGALEEAEVHLQKHVFASHGELGVQGRMCVAHGRSGDSRDKSNGGGMVIGSNENGSIEYIEPPAAVEQNNELIEARAEMMAEEERVRWQLTDEVVGCSSALQQLLTVVGWLDTIVARFRYTEWINGLFPEFNSFPWKRRKGGDNDEAWVWLRALRHPLLQGWYLRAHAQARRQRARSGGGKGKRKQRRGDPDAPDQVVPVDIIVPGPTRCVVITGPNTGGKTATLKALGLAVLLANAGCGVPCAETPVMPHFSAVLADIGDEQSLSGNLSTFSGHLARIQAARKEADGQCLMLLDEVGTGTDPVGAHTAPHFAIDVCMMPSLSS